MEEKDQESEVGYEAWLTRKVGFKLPANGERVKKTFVGEITEEYEAPQIKMAEHDPQQKPHIEKMKTERENWIKTAKDQESRLIAKVEQTGRDLSNRLQDYHIAQDKREKAKARLVRVGKEERELVRPRATSSCQLPNMRKHQRTALDILGASAKNLADLGSCVSQLTEFFYDILSELSVAVERDVRVFLELIKRRARLNTEGELESMAFGTVARKVR